METKKLYRVTLHGFLGSYYKNSYIVAKNPDEAYKTVRAFLNQEDVGFSQDRELHSIELIAEDKKYPDCESMLFIA